MDMTRRGFLAALGAVVLDPEKLLWVPGERTIFIPKTDVRLATQEELDWLAAVNHYTRELVYGAPLGDFNDPTKSMSPFWKLHYMRQHGLAEPERVWGVWLPGPGKRSQGGGL